MKVLRSTFVAAAAIFAAACGDKVEIIQPTTPASTPTVNSVTVSPSSVTLSVGQTLSFTAIVDVSNGAATTVTWNTTVTGLTVNTSTGALSAVPASAAGNSGSVCATSTADATKKGCAQVVITAAAANVPAQVSIASITGAGGLNAPVNPAAVAGQIDIRLNVNPGSQTPTKIVLLVGGVRQDSQTFTAAQAASLRFAADEAAEQQSTFPQIVFSVNTAAFNATTGAPRWLNANQLVSAQLFTAQAGTSTAATATAQQTLTFANANAFSTTVTVGGATAANANNAAGFRYNRGDVVISMIPVSYSGVALASVGVNFGTLACDGGAAVGGQKTRTLTAPAAGTFAWTGTFANSGAAGATTMVGYSFNAGACAAANNTGEQVSVVAAQDANGNPFTTTALPIVTGGGFRVDNLAPAAPVLGMTVASRRNTLAWVNDAVPFNRTAAGNGGIITAAVVDAGVGGGVGVSTDETLIYTTTVGGTALTNASTLAESVVNTTYSATATAKDLLGNTSAASAAATFGVDRTVPTIAALGAPATATVIAAPGGVAFGAFTYLDPATLPAGPSTPSATPARVDIQRRTTATASTRWNAVSAAFNSTGGPSNFGLAGPMIDPGATNVQAYYVVTAFVEDGAANPSLSVTRTYLFDTTAPTGPFSIPVMTTSAGAANLFSSSLTDNLDISTSQWGNNYAALDAAPGAAGAQILAAPTSFGAFESFTTTATSTNPLPLLRSMTGVTGAGVPTFPGGVLVAVSHTVTDRAALAATAGPTAVPAVNLPALPATDPYVPAGIAAAFGAGATTGFSVTAPAAAVTVDASGTTVAAGNVTSVAISATTVGTVNVALNPFARVEFYAYYAGTNSYRLIGTATTPTVVDNATNRVYTWTITWDPSTIGGYDTPVAVAGLPVVAIGVNATHDGVRSAANVNITTVP